MTAIDSAYHSHVSELISELAVTTKGYTQHYDESSALDFKSESLISLAVAVATNHNDCIERHVLDAFIAGASEQEINETVHIAVRVAHAGVDCGAEALSTFDGLAALEVAHPD